MFSLFSFWLTLSVFPFSGSIKTEITKNLFTAAENNFGEIKLSCTGLNFGEILSAGRKREVPGRQYHSILPAWVSNQSTEFAAYCPLAELAIIIISIDTIISTELLVVFLGCVHRIHFHLSTSLISYFYYFRENTLHALKQGGGNLGRRRPLVTEMVSKDQQFDPMVIAVQHVQKCIWNFVEFNSGLVQK